MPEPAERRFLSIVSGEARGVGPTLARATLSAAEPAYRAASALRNFFFDKGLWKIHRVDRPVISVGNLTTGGTGKTPVVARLADHLRRSLGATVGILTRGYRSVGGRSDEAMLLSTLLHDPAQPAALICVNPDRVAAAQRAIAEHPEIAAFVMDDGFQHRRLHRDFDLLLIDATNAFGFDHVLPRGLLRESVRGLRRAHAVLLTRVDQASPAEITSIIDRIVSISPGIPILQSSHTLGDCTLLGRPGEPSAPPTGKRVLAFAGIANPLSFQRMLLDSGVEVVASKWFADHHSYTSTDIDDLKSAATRHGADALITTGKDATKLAAVAPAEGLPIIVAGLRLALADGHEQRLLSLVRERLAGVNERQR